MPEIYVMGGCNGSGKTTLALNIFPNLSNSDVGNIEKAIENHRQKGESIAMSDEQGKVKIISADEIPKLQRVENLSAD
ncbi:MAG: hypothetical protein AAGF83_12855 [Cyanobacteria bacterium P01_G01_bin.67]